MLAVTIHTVPTSLKKDTSSCEALSSHSPPHTARNCKHSFYLGGQGCPGTIMAIVGQRECTSSATPSLPASSLFPHWSGHQCHLAAQHPRHCALSRVGGLLWPSVCSVPTGSGRHSPQSAPRVEESRNGEVP